MENRAILAFALSAVLLVAYLWIQDAYFAPPPRKPTVATEKPKAAAPEPRQSQVTREATPTPPPRQATERPKAVPPQATGTVDAPLYRAIVSSEGGKLQELVLHYRGEKAMVAVGELGPRGLLVGAARGGAEAPVPMTVTPRAVTIRDPREVGDIVLAGDAGDIGVQETLRFHGDSYVMEAVVRLENRGAGPATVTVRMPWETTTQWTTAQEAFIGQRPTEIVWSVKGDIERAEKLAAVPHVDTEGEWIGMDSVWYLTALMPKSPGFRVATLSEAPAGGASGHDKTAPPGKVAVEVRATPTIAAGQAWEGRVVIYAGPKEYERLKPLGLEETINFGGFPIPRRFGGLPMEWLGVPILLLLKWVYRYVGNYGVAIILLTIVTRVLFYPLTVRSMRSMKAMQALQPQINSLRSKYKSDPQRLQKETLDLYRAHGVNPMGGCLPMVAQVPIFYALYLALSVSVDLQNAPFICVGHVFGADVWICNLASHDPTYVLPILMGVSMFVQQRMSPTGADPRQAKMMLVMPFVFTFMFLNLPSGLVLYWTVSNVLQVLQQVYMDRSRGRGARQAKAART